MKRTVLFTIVVSLVLSACANYDETHTTQYWKHKTYLEAQRALNEKHQLGKISDTEYQKQLKQLKEDQPWGAGDGAY